jgi:hypothetical protein
MERSIENTLIQHLRLRYLFLSFAALFLFANVLLATPQISTATDGETMTIDDAPEMEVIAISKTVVIKKQAKEVLVWGGDVIVEGRVEGDVAAFGGSVIQKENGYIGGDVIVVGGQYKAESAQPLRAEGKQTVMIGVFEDELRSLAQDPSQILTPKPTLSFFIQRLLSALFWFVVTVVAATIAPGAVSRATARLKLSALKVTAIGVAGFLATCVAMIVGMSVLPEYLSAIVGLMVFAMIMLAYGFGRVVLHVSLGKLIQDRMTFMGTRSDTLAILFGVLACTIILSLPYIWTVALFLLFSLGTGLVITARSSGSWKLAR